MNAIEEMHRVMNVRLGSITRDANNDIRRVVDRIESEYMELPMDCNGEVIHVGDEIRYDDGYVDKVAGVCDNDYIIVTDRDTCDHEVRGVFLLASKCELVEHDSMDAIIADCEKSAVDYWGCLRGCFGGAGCDARVDGVPLHDRYNTDCASAMRLNLVERTEILLGGGK